MSKVSEDVASALKASDALLERQLDDCAKRIGERIKRELLGDKPRV